MTALTFSLKNAPAQRLDVSPLSPHCIAGMSVAEINALQLICGKQRLRVDQVFAVSGEDCQAIVYKKPGNKLDRIGHQMNSGSITVEGDAGAYLGLGMRGGKITVTGNTHIFPACQMHNGLIEIEGNAGDYLGGALPGNKQGMRGGTVVVKGNGGDRLGDSMRRGTILVEGNVGDYCASRMIAGTIAVMGSTGNHIGYGMSRGTLLLWQAPNMPPTFVDCGRHTLSFLTILFRSLGQIDSKFAAPDMIFQRVTRFAGDISAAGRGEILVKAQ